MPSPRRAAPLALALALGLAGCEEVDGLSCPGVPAGTFAFQYSDAPLAGVDVGGTPVVSGCVPRQVGDTTLPAGTYVPVAGETLPKFQATITLEGVGGAAFCAPKSTRFGTRTGADVVFEDAVFDGAVMSASEPGPGVCGTNCPVRMVEKVGGTLCGGPDWPPCASAGTSVEFHGWVIEEFDVPESSGSTAYDCGDCGGTCRGVWLLDSTP